jgi:VCBS repeat-containing protein
MFLFSILFILILNVGFTGEVANHAPYAEMDFYEAVNNNELSVSVPGVLINDSDDDGDAITAVLDTNPSHGTLSFNADGSFLYHPNISFPFCDYEEDSFTYHVNDGSMDSNIARVLISVMNEPPFAENDIYGTAPNQILNVTEPGVLSNDGDGNGDILSVWASLWGPEHGSLLLNQDGSFTYQPEVGFVGEDSFSYFVTDGNLTHCDFSFSNEAIVTIIVSDVPIAADDNYQTGKNVVLNVTAPGILGNDTAANGVPLAVVANIQPAHGTLILNSDGSFTYTPNTDYVGADSFTYHAYDGVNNSNIATVNLTVNLYYDDFNDGNLDPNWTYDKKAWTESGGTLIGESKGRKAIAVAPVLSGCQTCSMEAIIRVTGGKVWMLAWYVDKKNTLELLMNEQNEHWVLKQRVNGSVVAKAKGIKQIDPNTDYNVRISFDGTNFQVFVDDFATPLFTLTPRASVPVGTVGLQIKKTTASFDYVAVK